MSDTKNVSDLSSALLEAMSITSNANTSIGASMLEARIKEVVDEGLGIYKVQYLDNIFEATAANRDVTYALDEMVYILVPEGNLDKTRLIIAPVAGYETVYADALNDKFYISLGDDLLGKYINEDDYELSLCSYKTVYPPANFKNSQGSTIDFSGLEDDLKYALADSRVFNFACEIKTAIPADQRNRGNYGLVMTIPLLKDGIENDYVVTLDISNLRGDPYNYEVYAPQNCYFTIPEKTIFNKSKKIKLQYFVKDFIGQSNTMPDDIFIKNITIISTFEATADNMAGYRLKVLASGGNTFYGNYETTSKILSANLYLDGKATKPNNFDCYWFKENVAVNTSHAKYHPLGGIGWEILNELTNVSTINGGDETYQYVTNLYTYTIRGIDILADTNYKCVLVKDSQTVQDTVMIKVINAAIKMNLYSNRVDNTFIENIGNAIISMQYIDTRESIDDIIVSYVWKRFDRFGNLVDWAVDRTLPSIVGQDEDENNIYQSDVILPVSEIDEFTTIKCGVINTFVKDNNTYEKVVGSSSLVVKTTDRVDYSIYIENGDKLYKYDADGDSPLVADYDGPLTSAIKTITPISIRLFKPDGDEFSEGEYAVTTIDWLIPINSMIVISNSLKTDSTTNPGYWTIHGSYESLKSFSYSIANVFDKNKTDNSIIIRAYFKSNEISNVAHIRFLKDGMSGTNGSKYSAIVTYDGYGYGEKDEDGNEVKLQLYYIADSSSHWYLYNTQTKINSCFECDSNHIILDDDDSICVFRSALIINQINEKRITQNEIGTKIIDNFSNDILYKINKLCLIKFNEIKAYKYSILCYIENYNLENKDINKLKIRQQRSQLCADNELNFEYPKQFDNVVINFYLNTNYIFNQNEFRNVYETKKEQIDKDYNDIQDLLNLLLNKKELLSVDNNVRFIINYAEFFLDVMKYNSNLIEKNNKYDIDIVFTCKKFFTDCFPLPKCPSFIWYHILMSIKNVIDDNITLFNNTTFIGENDELSEDLSIWDKKLIYEILKIEKIKGNNTINYENAKIKYENAISFINDITQGFYFNQNIY